MRLTKATQRKFNQDIESFRRYDSSKSHKSKKKSHADMHHDMSVRQAQHAGKKIEIRTHYEITVDGEALKAHVSVGNDGKAHCHALPNYGFGSMVDLVRELIDTFDRELPEDELIALVGSEAARKIAKKPDAGKKTRKRKAKKKAKRKPARKKSSKKRATRRKTANRKTKRRTKRGA